MTLPIEYEAFDRQDGESAEEYELFTEYCRIPPSSRNMRNLSRRISVPSTRLSFLSKKWNWINRAAAFDNASLALRPDPTSMDEEASLAAQLAASAALLDLGLRAIELKDPSRIPVTKANELVKSALEIQRRALGEADITVQVNHDDLKRVNDLIGDLIEDAEVIEIEAPDEEDIS